MTWSFGGGYVTTERALSAADVKRIQDAYHAFGYDVAKLQEWVDKGMPVQMLLTFEQQLVQLLREHYRQTGNCVDVIHAKWYDQLAGDSILAEIEVSYTARAKKGD